MACVGVALALRAHSTCTLGVWGMLPQENFRFLDCVSGMVKVRYLDI